MPEPTALTLTDAHTGDTIELTELTGIVAGYTGRDAAAVQHHIDELAAIGVAPPPEVPMFYPVSADSYSTAEEFPGSPNLTSGEIEPAYIRHQGRYYLGIGSDHTDRDLETEDIGRSKQACPKPIGRRVIPIDDIDTFSLDEAVARCWADGVLYQEGVLSAIRTPGDVVQRLIARTDAGDADFVCLGGTLPLLNGTFENAAHWRLELTMPDGTVLDHEYRITKGTSE